MSTWITNSHLASRQDRKKNVLIESSSSTRPHTQTESQVKCHSWQNISGASRRDESEATRTPVAPSLFSNAGNHFRHISSLYKAEIFSCSCGAQAVCTSVHHSLPNQSGITGLPETRITTRRAVRSHFMIPSIVSVLVYFSCLGERCNALLLSSSRNVSSTMKLHMTFHGTRAVSR